MAGKRKYENTTDLIAVRVPTALNDALKRKAEQEGRSKSEVVVRTLEEAMPASPPTIFD